MMVMINENLRLIAKMSDYYKSRSIELMDISGRYTFINDSPRSRQWLCQFFRLLTDEPYFKT